MFTLLSNVAAPAVRETTVLEYSSSVPWFLQNPGWKGKQCWFLSLHPVNTAFGHKLEQGSLPLPADKAETHLGAICTPQLLRSNSQDTRPPPLKKKSKPKLDQKTNNQKSTNQLRLSPECHCTQQAFTLRMFLFLFRLHWAFTCTSYPGSSWSPFLTETERIQAKGVR